MSRVLAVVDLPQASVWWPPARRGLLEVKRVTLAETRTRSESSHTVLIYEDRLAIHNGDALSWEDLASIKNELWGPDVMAFEAFPVDEEVINLRPTRHLWRTILGRLAVAECSRRLHDLHKME